MATQLSQDQLIQNIQAMQSQGASQANIQEYLDSLKGSASPSGPTDAPIQKTPGNPTGSPSGMGSLATLGKNLAAAPGQIYGAATEALPMAGAIGGGILGAGGGLVAGGPIGAWAGGAAGAGAGGAAGTALQEVARGEPINSAKIAGAGVTYGALDAVGGPVLSAFGKGAERLATAIPAVKSTLAKVDFESILQDIMPKMTDGEKATYMAGKKTGANNPSGVMGKITLRADKYMKEVGDLVQREVPGFAKLNSFTEKLNAVKGAITKSYDSLESKIGETGKKIGFNFETLASDMARVERPIAIKADQTLNRQFSIAQEAALKIARKAGGTVKGLVKGLHEFDALVSKEFPTLYDRTNAPMRNAITSMRDVMKSMIARGLRQAGAKFDYEAILKEQSKLMTAMENLSEKAAPEVETGRAGRFIENNPKMVSAAKWLGGFATAGGAGVLLDRELLGGSPSSP